MTLNSFYMVLFRKKPNPDIPAFVRIKPISAKAKQGPYAFSFDYEVNWDDYVVFDDGTTIDGTTRIVWGAAQGGPLTKPCQLTLPERWNLPGRRAKSYFKDEQ